MSRNLLILLSICCVIALGTFWMSRDATNEKEITAIGDFSYTDMNKKSGSLYQHKNKPVVLHFWATWCVPCLAEIPVLVEKAAATPSADFFLISVDQNTQALEKFLSPLQKKMTKNVTLIQDANMAITAKHFNVSQFPESLILNTDKTVRQRVIGAANWPKLTIAP